eukprot:TRINITY_DN1268_c0_g2_i2.p1 TRINITY_DN1268_c0_g2~~TRINITY_DN1268_c0_g2_i2.p1  ORF type:complete len:256 (-),score=67.55 TRINITY_DN1268_c0_g2_i2:166-933(-)
MLPKRVEARRREEAEKLEEKRKEIQRRLQEKLSQTENEDEKQREQKKDDQEDDEDEDDSCVHLATEMIHKASKVLEEKAKKLKTDRKKLEQEKETIKGVIITQEGMVKLNIGGKYFCTSKDTLTKDPNSMLAVMFSGRFKLINHDGCYFIDRDGTYFRHILNYLRGCEFSIPSDPEVQKAILQEAKFYQLIELEKMLTPLSCRVCGIEKEKAGRTKCTKHSSSVLTCMCRNSGVGYCLIVEVMLAVHNWHAVVCV